MEGDGYDPDDLEVPFLRILLKLTRNMSMLIRGDFDNFL